MAQTSQVSGIVQVDGTPAQRAVRAFGYEAVVHEIDGSSVTLSKSLGHAVSDAETGEYTIDLLDGYGNEIFVVAFDDYGDDFSPDMTVNVGDRVHPITSNGHVFECTGSGTLPSEEPDWIIDTETSQLYGTASMIARVFYRPMVHGPVAPEVINNLVPAEARYVRFYINQAHNSAKEPMLAELWVEYQGAQLLAKTEVITASGVFDSSIDYSPENLLDGSVSTVDTTGQGDSENRWISDTLADSWVNLDLGSKKEFDKIHVLGAGTPGEDRCPIDWRIEISDDGTNWQTIYETNIEPEWFINQIRSYDALVASSTATDEYFNSVTLLLHMDGTVGSTDFVDSSSTPKAMTAQGNAQIGSDGKFDQALSLGGGGDALVVTEGTLYGDADLTIEAQVHPTSSAATNEIVSSSDGATFDLVFEIPTDLRLRAQIRNAANSSEVNIELNSAADVIALDTWQHVALTAEGSTAKLWVNGAEVASGSITGTRGESLAGVQIGRLNSGRYFIGRMDELRITKGVARYTGAFTPPTEPFPDQGSS